jgi:hypothetical protein
MSKTAVMDFYWKSGGHEQRKDQLRTVSADTAQYERYLKRIVKYEQVGLLIGAGTWAGHFMEPAQKFGFAVKGYEVIPATCEAANASGYDVTMGFFEDVYDVVEEASVVTAWEMLEHAYEARRFLESEKFKVETIFTVGGTDIANVLSCFFCRNAFNSYNNLIKERKKTKILFSERLILRCIILLCLNIAPIIFAIARKTS